MVGDHGEEVYSVFGALILRGKVIKLCIWVPVLLL